MANKSFIKIGCSEVPKQSYPPYFDQLSERHQPLWSIFVFVLVIWSKQVTLVSWPQPSGLLCLWLCFFYFSVRSTKTVNEINEYISLLGLPWDPWTVSGSHSRGYLERRFWKKRLMMPSTENKIKHPAKLSYTELAETTQACPSIWCTACTQALQRQ